MLCIGSKLQNGVRNKGGQKIALFCFNLTGMLKLYFYFLCILAGEYVRLDIVINVLSVQKLSISLLRNFYSNTRKLKFIIAF